MNTIVEILEELGIRYVGEEHRHCGRGWVGVDCPYCGPGSGRYHLGFHVKHLYANCWRCGGHGIAHALSLLSNRSYLECRVMLGEVDRGDLATAKIFGKYTLPNGVCDLLPAHMRYLENRGFCPIEISKLWGIRGIGLHHRLTWRLWIPITYQGQTVSWTARSIGKSNPRYISARPDEESALHRSLLYGEDYCRHAVVVHEGPTDVWRTGPGSVATFGTGFSRSQVLRLSKYPVRVVCFDSDTGAQRRARKLADDLSSFPGETYNVVLDSKDAGVASPAETKILREFLETGVVGEGLTR